MIQIQSLKSALHQGVNTTRANTEIYRYPAIHSGWRNRNMGWYKKHKALSWKKLCADSCLELLL